MAKGSIQRRENQRNVSFIDHTLDTKDVSQVHANFRNRQGNRFLNHLVYLRGSNLWRAYQPSQKVCEIRARPDYEVRQFRNTSRYVGEIGAQSQRNAPKKKKQA